METVEFHPPAALNSLEAALAYKGEVDGEDVVSLIVYLAGKGYLRIEEASKGDFILRKMKEYDGNNKVERNSNVLFYENSTNKNALLAFMAVGSVILSLYHPVLDDIESIYSAVMTSALLGGILVFVIHNYFHLLPIGSTPFSLKTIAH